MEKKCACGRMMTPGLRTVIFKHKVYFKNVPVYTCEHCLNSEVMGPVKQEITDYIDRLGDNIEKQVVRLDEINELARLLKQVTDKNYAHLPAERLVEDRINELLDLLLLARSLGDDVWLKEVRARLGQLAKFSLSASDIA